VNSGLMLMNSSENAEMASLAATTPSTMRTRLQQHSPPEEPGAQHACPLSRLRILAPARVQVNVGEGLFPVSPHRSSLPRMADRPFGFRRILR
jgi:hypothetical protein